MSALLHDLRLALRQFRHHPGFAVTTIVTLALGIGAITAVFSLVNAVLLRPLPFPHAERLMWALNADLTPGMAANTAQPLSYPDFFDWRAQSHSFDGMASYHDDNFTFTGHGEPRQLNAAVVSSEFFRVLGVRPMLGRDLLGEDEKPGASVAMLSYQLWQSAFGGMRDVIGRSIMLDGRRYTVAGVMPAGFGFPIQDPAPVLWTTLADDARDEHPPTSQRGFEFLNVVARLKAGVSVGQARAELSVIARRLATQYPDSNKHYGAALLEPQLERMTGDVRPALRLLFAAVMFVLLIACANVAGLMLARASRRRGEIALRAALGAGRGRIIRQILAESVLLALCGGGLGVVLSSWTLEAMLRFVPANVPRAGQISVDGTVLGFVTAVSLLTGLLFGVLPAWRMSRLDPARALREGARSVTAGRGHQRVHNWLVIAETAVGLVLLVGAGLLIRSFVRVLNIDPGFDPRHVLTARVSLPLAQYSQGQRLKFYDRLLPELGALPGVQSAAAGFPLPLGPGGIGITFGIEGRPVAAGDQPAEQLAIITPDFFRTMRIPLLAGRDFAAEDAHGRPVVIVNDNFARKYFPGENPLGKRIKPELSDGITPATMREIVGVVGSAKRRGLTGETEPQYYLPFAQAQITAPPICIRTAGDPASFVGTLRARLAEIDKNVPLYQVETLEGYVYKAAAQPRFQTLLFSCFAGMALLLAAVGLYALLSYVVVLRTQEIGVRVALGAQRGDVVGLIVRRGLMLASTGVAIGLAAAGLLSRFMAGMLFGVEPWDPVTFASVSAILMLVAALASSVPAWRAARLDPIETLRDQ